MANRRMFSKNITSSDSFLSMSATAQNLYFHLGMEADDDGFAPFTKISKMLGTSPDDMAQLLARGFLLQFPYGVFVIRDWKVNNEIKADRYQPTLYQKEFRCLKINESRQYYIDKSILDTIWIQDGDTLDTQVRLGKVRLGKDMGTPAKAVSTPKLDLKDKTQLTEQDFIDISNTFNVSLNDVKKVYEQMRDWMCAKGKIYRDHKAALRNWIRKDIKDGCIKVIISNEVEEDYLTKISKRRNEI